MATAAQWVQGARPRTLPAALAPVLAGTGVAIAHHGGDWLRAGLALVVSLALQVAVNYANDYSDGVRGTDADRVGPLRLVGSGAAEPRQVKFAAFAAFGVAAAAGLVLALLTAWWLVLVGVLAILAAWFYTGGSRPYGYSGLGEVMVFVFFGLVAVVGSAYVQQPRLTGGFWRDAVLAACAVGALACAILVANNLRDIPTDEVAGKRTLAVRLGDRGTRVLFTVLALAPVALTVFVPRGALIGLVYLAIAVPAVRRVLGGAQGRDLVPGLASTGLAELLYAGGLFAGLVIFD